MAVVEAVLFGKTRRIMAPVGIYELYKAHGHGTNELDMGDMSMHSLQHKQLSW